MNYLEILGTAVGIVYLWLEYRASVWLWAASIAMPSIYLWVYYDAGLYADLGISIYYILASVYGLICWLAGRQHHDGGAKPVARTPRTAYVPLALTAATLWALIGYILERYTDSTVPWADAFTTALSIVAMWMLARKYVEQWLVWIAADVACAILYTYKGLWFTGALYLAYAVIAVAGYRKWKLMLTQQ